MLARGALGNPWLFARLLGTRDDEPTTAEVLDELEWVMQRAVEHMGERRAGRYLRKFYPWYVERIGGSKALQAALQATDTIDEARAVLGHGGRRDDCRLTRCYPAASPADPPLALHPPCGGVFDTSSSMPKDVILTADGLEKLKAELAHPPGRQAQGGRAAHQGGARVR